MDLFTKCGTELNSLDQSVLMLPSDAKMEIGHLNWTTIIMCRGKLFREENLLIKAERMNKIQPNVSDKYLEIIEAEGIKHNDLK